MDNTENIVENKAPSKSKLLLVFACALILALVFVAGYLFATKNQFIPKSTPLPIVSVTPNLNPTDNWKTYTNSFGKFSIKHPSSVSINEKLFSDKDRQITLTGTSGTLTFNIAASDYSPGWGGGCDPQYKKKIVFVGESDEICESETWISQLYSHHPDSSRDFQISATFNPPYGENKEEILQILSTFQFLDQNSTPEPTNWLSYLNKEGGYSIKYPSSYQAYENETYSPDGVLAPEENTYEIISSEIPNLKTNFALIIRFKLNSKSTSLSEMAQNYQCLAVTSSKGESFLVDSHEALIFKDTPCGVSGSTVIFTINNGISYTITIVSGSNYKEITSFVDQILSTFRFD